MTPLPAELSGMPLGGNLGGPVWEVHPVAKAGLGKGVTAVPVQLPQARKGL